MVFSNTAVYNNKAYLTFADARASQTLRIPQGKSHKGVWLLGGALGPSWDGGWSPGSHHGMKGSELPVQSVGDVGT